MSDSKPVNRRAFFRAGLRELLKPIASAVEPVEEAVRQLGKLDAQQNTKPRTMSLNAWLRPPGALPEGRFTDTCSRCGKCVEVCPAQCIKIDTIGMKGRGFPYINADVMPCVVCESLACMHHCPSGALLPTPLVEIDMGTAEWREQSCLRTRGKNASNDSAQAGAGEDCTICIDHCPLGAAAIELRAGKVRVIEEGCIGCGVCQHDCPTSPKSIVVIAKMARS